MSIILTAAMLVLVAVHLTAGRLHVRDPLRRTSWLSFAGGVSVTYVFLELLPEMAEAQHVLAGEVAALEFLEHHVYLVALAGLAAFYGIETWVRNRRRSEVPASDESDSVFWIHIGAFAVYNVLVGYLMVEREPYEQHLPAYTIAMALHFVVTDFGLRSHHDTLWERKGRFVLAAAIAAGYALGLQAQVPEAFVSVIAAVVAGGAILHVMKEELPEENASRFAPFLAGVVIASILLAIR